MAVKKQRIYQVDAFTNKIFGGNPAAVCVLDSWLSPEMMQSIAAENNLSETAYVVKGNKDYAIRWFTPTTEVALCGHATLAAAYVLFHQYGHSNKMIHFYSDQSGQLKVSRDKDLLTLDFPADEIKEVAAPREILAAFQKPPLEVFKGKTDYLLRYGSQKEIEESDPNHFLLRQSSARGVVITAPGIDVDFVSRFFAPGSGVDEDPVTGSAHTTLTPYWSKKFGKTHMKARQLSQRKGELHCEMAGSRVKISGKAVLYMIGEIYFEDPEG